MQDQFVNIATPDGQMETFITHPNEGGPFPVVILYMDAPGIREELYDFARRVGTVGYYCMLPDLYYRSGRIRYDRAKMTDEDRRINTERWTSITNANLVDDTQGMLNFLASATEARKGPMGCVGYCMSGQWVLTQAGTYPEHFKATAAVHGVKHITDQPDSPHLLAPKFQGEVYCAYAERDAWVGEGEIAQLTEAFTQSPAKTLIEEHADTDHGYVFPEREIYVKHAAERTWEVIFAMFQRQLKPYS